MGKDFPLLLIIFCMLIPPLSYAQTSVKVSDPGLEIRDNTLLISYDILNSDPDEKYIISVDIKDEDGNPINANSLSGDIGEINNGRGHKKITWDFESDNVFLDAYVFVQINAKVVPPPPPPVVEEQVVEEQVVEEVRKNKAEQTDKEQLLQDNQSDKMEDLQNNQAEQADKMEDLQDNQSEIENEEPGAAARPEDVIQSLKDAEHDPKDAVKEQEDAIQGDESKKPVPVKEIAQDTNPETEVSGKQPPPANNSTSFNRAGIVLQSLALPGLGLSRVTGKPHWLRGAAGYGCIAGSIILNRQAVKTFGSIDDLVYFDEINEAFDKSLLQDNISEILSFAAIGIWVADIIWTLVGTSDLNTSYDYSESGRSSYKGFSIGSRIDPFSHVPLMSLNYRF